MHGLTVSTAAHTMATAQPSPVTIFATLWLAVSSSVAIPGHGIEPASAFTTGALGFLTTLVSSLFSPHDHRTIVEHAQAAIGSTWL